MPVADEAMLAMWAEVLDLCRLTSDEACVVLAGDGANQQNLASALRSMARRGARPVHLSVPPVAQVAALGTDRSRNVGTTPLSGHRFAVDTLKRADLVIDLMGLLHSEEQLEVLAAGTRMLMVLEPPEILAQMIPSQGDKTRVMAADARLRAAKTMRVTSKAGTDLAMNVGCYPTLPEYGFADEPGHWDHWPSGFVSTWPEDDSAEGMVVVDVGDMLFPFKTYVTSPIAMEIHRGRIRRIEGGFEAKYLRKFIEAYHDDDAFAVAHVGWGLQPKARWTGLGLRDKAQSLGMDARAFYGNFLFSTGPNAEAGGPNNARCHIDIPMADCSVSLDGEPIVVDGDVVAADQRVPSKA